MAGVYGSLPLLPQPPPTAAAAPRSCMLPCLLPQGEEKRVEGLLLQN